MGGRIHQITEWLAAALPYALAVVAVLLLFSLADRHRSRRDREDR